MTKMKLCSLVMSQKFTTRCMDRKQRCYKQKALKFCMQLGIRKASICICCVSVVNKAFHLIVTELFFTIIRE